jgi:hypothetical protein
MNPLDAWVNLIQSYGWGVTIQWQGDLVRVCVDSGFSEPVWGSSINPSAITFLLEKHFFRLVFQDCPKLCIPTKYMESGLVQARDQLPPFSMKGLLMSPNTLREMVSPFLPREEEAPFTLTSATYRGVRITVDDTIPPMYWRFDL